MRIMIIAASDLPIPAYKGGATETLITDLLEREEIKSNSSLAIDVFSHCSGERFSDGNVTYYFYKKRLWEKIYFFVMRIIRICLLKKIYIPDVFPMILAKDINLKEYDLVILEGCMQQVLTTRTVYKGKLALHIHTVMTLTKNTPGAVKIVNKCDYLIANSEFAKRTMELIESNVKGKVLLWKNCIKTELFQSDFEKMRNGFRKEHNLTVLDFLYIYCGRLEPGKGVLELIEAFKKADVRGKLLIVGASWFSSDKKTSYVKKLEEAAGDLKDRIIFTGYVKHENIAQYYHFSDVAIMPSIYKESAGLVAIEAQASGIPVIISDIGGIPEFVHSESGLKVKPDEFFVENLASLMKKLQDDKSFYLHEKALAVSNSREYGMDRYCREFFDILSDILDEK